MTTKTLCPGCHGNGYLPTPFDGPGVIDCPDCRRPDATTGPVTLLVVTRRGLEPVDDYPTLAAALDDARGLWMEEPAGPQLLVAVDQNGDYLAALMRPPGDPECCVTAHATGAVERHRCRYLLTPCGTYLKTEVLPC
jgi:hypothetical protein